MQNEQCVCLVCGKKKLVTLSASYTLCVYGNISRTVCRYWKRPLRSCGEMSVCYFFGLKILRLPLTLHRRRNMHTSVSHADLWTIVTLSINGLRNAVETYLYLFFVREKVNSLIGDGECVVLSSVTSCGQLSVTTYPQAFAHLQISKNIFAAFFRNHLWF